MDIYDEWNPTVNYQISSDLLLTLLQRCKTRKEQEIAELKEKIMKYDQKKKSEEAFYQSLSPVRKFFAARPPNHHQAVEYMVHVKNRLKQIDKVKQDISEVNEAIRHLKEDPLKKELALPDKVIEEIKKQRETED